MKRYLLAVGLWCVSLSAVAEDIAGAEDHPMISRYPEQSLRWQEISNNRPFKVPLGPVTGYRSIGEWAEVTGRVTRTFYVLTSERTVSEVYENYRSSLADQGFEIIGSGYSDSRNGVAIGSRQWLGVYLAENPFKTPGEVSSQAAGTSSQGGAGAIVAKKARASGDAYVVINVEQHAERYVGTLVDIVEVEATEVGLVVVDPEAMGRDIEEKGRVVLDGIQFEYDRAELKPESDGALAAIAVYLNANEASCFFVVGHTDSKGTFAYNQKLSSDRARSVVTALAARYGIAASRLQPHGVGPLVPVWSNGTDAGRAQNRRVELVARDGCTE